MMTAELLEWWLLRAPRGASIVYHRGQLARDAQVDPRVDRVGRYARLHSQGEFPEMSPCGHVRTIYVGAGELALRQRRVEPGCYEYVAVKR